MRRIFEVIRVPLGVMFALAALVKIYFLAFPMPPAAILSETTIPYEPRNAWIFSAAICLAPILLLFPRAWASKFRVLVPAFFISFGVLLIYSVYLQITAGHFLPEIAVSLLGLMLSLARYIESRSFQISV